MNLIKTLRKPYFSIFLASLMLFISCNTNTLERTNLNTDELKNVVENHIKISQKIASKFKNEDNIDINILSNSPKFFNNANELKATLKEAKVKNSEELTILFLELQNNLNTFLETIDAKNNYTKDEIEKIIVNEINLYLDEIEQNIVSSKVSNSCWDNYFRANARCERNWYIGVASVTISGFFSLGIGTIIGSVTVGTMLLVCENDAQNDRDECLANQG